MNGMFIAPFLDIVTIKFAFKPIKLITFAAFIIYLILSFKSKHSYLLHF